MKHWKGSVKVPTRGHPLVRRFFEIVNERQHTVVAVARRAGVTRNTIFTWHHSTPTLPSLEAALNVLGYRLAIVPLEKQIAHDTTNQSVINQLGA